MKAARRRLGGRSGGSRRGKPRRGLFEALEPRWLLAGPDPHLEFLQESAVYGSFSQSDPQSDPAIFLYSDYYAGSVYGEFHAERITADANDPDSAVGPTSLRLTWDGTGSNGWFQFWIGEGAENRPRDIADFGQAHAVRFFARGDTEGQTVVARVFRTQPNGGWQLLVNQQVQLNTTWQPVVIDLSAHGVTPRDLHAVQLVMEDGHPVGNRTFWLDEVRVVTDGVDPLRVPLSYRARHGDPAQEGSEYRDARIYPNRSFLYDTALTIKVLVASGEQENLSLACQAADALLAAVRTDGSHYNVRNAGHVLRGDGLPRAPISDTRTLGDNAWFGMALLDLYHATGEADYLAAARAISDWAELELKDTGELQGYLGGFNADGNLVTWRSTEHNIDLFALNRGLALDLALLGDEQFATYAERATHAGDFVIAMFDAVEGKFWTGTTEGDQLNFSSVPLDAQTWALLTLARYPQYAEALDWQRVGDWMRDQLSVVDGRYRGLTYSDASTPGIVWVEGTAQATVLAHLERDGSYAELIAELERIRVTHPHGDGRGMVATSSDELTDKQLGADYDARLHVGTTAWTWFAVAGVNPMIPQRTLPLDTGGMTWTIHDWNNVVHPGDLSRNYTGGNNGTLGETAWSLAAKSSQPGGYSLRLEPGGAAFEGFFAMLSAPEEVGGVPVPGMFIDTQDIYRGFGPLAGRSVDELRFDIWHAKGEELPLTVELEDESGQRAVANLAIPDTAGQWDTTSATVAIPQGFTATTFNWNQVTKLTLLVAPGETEFYLDNLRLVDTAGEYPDLGAVSLVDGQFDPAFTDAFLAYTRYLSSLYFVDSASRFPGVGGNSTEGWGGLVQDRASFPDVMSAAGAGFQLTSYVISAERGYFGEELSASRAEAAKRTRAILQVLVDRPQGSDANGMAGYQGFFYHFLNPAGVRQQDSELSSIDTALLLCGVVTAGAYFDGETADEIAIRDLAAQLYSRVNWDFLRFTVSEPGDANARFHNQFYLGWKPEANDANFQFPNPDGPGYFSGSATTPQTLDFYTDEGLLVALLAMGSLNPAHRLGREVWDAMIRDADGGDFVKTFPGSLFTYLFASLWVDTAGLGTDNHPTDPVDFFANTQAAIQATRDYVADNPQDRATWRENSRLWGLSAAEGPLGTYHAHAAPPAALDSQQSLEDGTVTVYGAASAIQHQPVAALDSLWEAKQQGLLNPRYGFADAYQADIADSIQAAGFETQIMSLLRDEGPWAHFNGFAIDQGPMLVAIDNYLSHGFVPSLFQSHPGIANALNRLQGNRADIAGRTDPLGNWWVAESSGHQFENVLWGRWSTNADWNFILAGDFTGNGHQDLAGLTAQGDWWVARSTGSGFTNEHWGRWSPHAGWTEVQVGDFNGDGRMDILGRTTTGDWWVARSTGNRFVNERWGRWSTTTHWSDLRIGDFTGNGRDDVAGRTENGQWWLARSQDTHFVNEYWGRWTPSAGWVDVQVGDFTGQGRASLVGRTASGHWWLARSDGSQFTNELWGRWSTNPTWVSVLAGDFTGNGIMDVVGRVAERGELWLARSTGRQFINQNWGRWSTTAEWFDVCVGDFSGDGRDDLAGRTNTGHWWVTLSTGQEFENERWGRWSTGVDWTTVVAGNFAAPAVVRPPTAVHVARSGYALRNTSQTIEFEGQLRADFQAPAPVTTNHAADAMTLSRAPTSSTSWESSVYPHAARAIANESPLRLAAAARAFAADCDLRFEDLWDVLVEPPCDTSEVDAFFDAW